MNARPDAELEDAVARLIWDSTWNRPNDEQGYPWAEAVESDNEGDDSEVFRCRYTARLVIAAIREALRG